LIDTKTKTTSQIFTNIEPEDDTIFKQQTHRVKANRKKKEQYLELKKKEIIPLCRLYSYPKSPGTSSVV
jgi:hypothetical protein